MTTATLHAGSWGLSGGTQGAISAPVPAPPRTAPTTPARASAAVEELLRRMRQGDRHAVAEFMDRYGARIRRRIRWKLSKPMRRLFDTMDVLSTVMRRLDLYVGQGKVEATVPDELWSLVLTMADHAVVDKVRIFRRLEQVEGSDSAFAASMLRRLQGAEASRRSNVEVEMEQVFRSLQDPLDRQILALWLEGHTHGSIGEHLGMSEAAARQRWHRIRETLRTLIDSGVLG